MRQLTLQLLYKIRNNETILATKMTGPFCPRHLRRLRCSPSHFPPRFHSPLFTGNSGSPLPVGEGQGEGQTGNHPDEPGRFPIPSGVRPRGTSNLRQQPSRSSGCHPLIGSVRVHPCRFVVAFASSRLCDFAFKSAFPGDPDEPGRFHISSGFRQTSYQPLTTMERTVVRMPISESFFDILT